MRTGLSRQDSKFRLQSLNGGGGWGGGSIAGLSPGGWHDYFCLSEMLPR